MIRGNQTPYHRWGFRVRRSETTLNDDENNCLFSSILYIYTIGLVILLRVVIHHRTSFSHRILRPRIYIPKFMNEAYSPPHASPTYPSDSEASRDAEGRVEKLLVVSYPREKRMKSYMSFWRRCAFRSPYQRSETTSRRSKSPKQDRSLIPRMNQ